jgi:hypothetical protein
MDEVWVPSHWQRQVFIDSGVDASRLRVVPEVRGGAGPRKGGRGGLIEGYY